jgi:hypothetical protein
MVRGRSALKAVLMAAILATSFTLSTQMAPEAAAQFREGDLVQQDDGSLYVYERGQLHAVQPVPASTTEISTATMGDAVTTGVMIIPPPAPAPAAAPPGLRLSVVSVDRPVGRASGAGREWAQIRLRIENGTDRNWDTGAYLIGPDVHVWDARGSTAGATSADTDFLGSNFLIPPGGAREGNLQFDVASGVPLVRVTWTDGGVVIMEASVP